jgi:hypothetical protein
VHHDDIPAVKSSRVYFTHGAALGSRYVLRNIFRSAYIGLFFCSRVPTMAVPHCSELSRAMETGIIQRNKIGRDGQYETEDEFYALVFTFTYRNLIDVKLN